MKLRLPFIIIFAAVFAMLWGIMEAHADLTWQTPIGTIGLPLTASQAVVGYDGILKVAIAGFSLPVYTDPKQFVSLQLGAVAPWQTNGASVEPYVALGHDLARELPLLSLYPDLHLNAFGRYDSETGKAGAGISFSYSFAQ